MITAKAWNLSYVSVALNFTHETTGKRIGFRRPKPRRRRPRIAFSSDNKIDFERPNRNSATRLCSDLTDDAIISRCDLSTEQKGSEEAIDVGGRKVECEVEAVSWKERRIRAEILVNADVESVWSVLTDYERLSDFIPNLVSSKKIPCPHPGKVRLEQRGLQWAFYWQIEACVVLDLQEFPYSENDREIHFSIVDGDFKKFEGKWSMKFAKRPATTLLCYDVSVIPRFNIPAAFVERIIRSNLPLNLQAVARQAEDDATPENT